MELKMEKTIKDIPSLNTWKIVQPITEGWSNDKKYYIKDDKGFQFLLRISDGQSYKREHQYYDALRELNNEDLLVSKLLDTGLCNEEKNTFRLFSWIEGVEMIKVIGALSKKEQYNYGVEAGMILRKIHKIKSPSNRISWGVYYSQKIDKKIAIYRNCGRTFPHSERMIDYIQRHRNLIERRPQSFHHGDFHIGNMLLTPEKKVGVIDFNRLDFGDPWEEFNRITWSASKSSWFASGQINGYFDNDVPKDFFELMALYIGVNLVGSIAWAIPFGDKEINVMLSQIAEALEWYENFEQSIPKWYRSGF